MSYTDKIYACFQKEIHKLIDSIARKAVIDRANFNRLNYQFNLDHQNVIIAGFV